jgi:AcrR family transcriptional regulator
VIKRAGVSRSIFFEIFFSVEECYRAAFDKGLERLSQRVVEATAREQAWLERVRSGLVAMLGFFDDEPSWARLLLCETPLDGAVTFECGQRLHGVLAALLERSTDVGEPDGASQSGASQRAGSPALLATLTGELVVGGVFSVIRTNLLEGDGKLVELAPSLMAFIVAPYLGQVAAQAELEGKPSGASEMVVSASEASRARAISPATELPIRATHRTTLVLRAIARAPYSNNREVAHAAGLADEGQTSKLLARLVGKGVIENVGVGATRGEPNAWLLTASGRRTVELLDGISMRSARTSSRRSARNSGTRSRGAA